MSVDENTPLLVNGDDDAAAHDQPPANGAAKSSSSRWARYATPELRIMVAGFLISSALCFTQVPLLYAFRAMECDVFYSHRPPDEPEGDRCARPEVDAGTAFQMTIMGLSAIICGVCNLILTGMQIKRWGPYFSLLLNNFFPILRVSMQAIALGVGGVTGITLLQCSQVLAIVGGPAGYLLVLNTSIAEVVEPAARTASFGKLQGSAMFGTALGYLLGGIVAQAFTIRRPFEVTVVLLIITFFYCLLFVPYIDPKTMGGADSTSAAPAAKKQSSFFWSSLGPQTLRLKDGKVVKTFAVTLLSLAIFIADLAIGYAPVLTQMYAINELGFSPTNNSVFMAVNFAVRGAFLLLAFPTIASLPFPLDTDQSAISRGRKWFATRRDALQPDPIQTETIPTSISDMNPIIGTLAEEEPINLPVPIQQDEGAKFDLWFLRWSMVGDVFITGCIGFSSQPWHIFLAGLMLPLFSGADAASKGVLTEMVPASQRADALQSISLIQAIAALTTVGVFGLLFSALSAIGQGHLTFFCTAAVALVAIILLLFVTIPPTGSTIELDEEVEADVPTTPNLANTHDRER